MNERLNDIIAKVRGIHRVGGNLPSEVDRQFCIDEIIKYLEILENRVDELERREQRYTQLESSRWREAPSVDIDFINNCKPSVR